MTKLAIYITNAEQFVKGGASAYWAYGAYGADIDLSSGNYIKLCEVEIDMQPFIEEARKMALEMLTKNETSVRAESERDLEALHVRKQNLLAIENSASEPNNV